MTKELEIEMGVDGICECEVFFCGKENILEFARDGCYTTLLIC